MAILCNLAGHTPDAAHHRNQGLEFSCCHQCGCDLIRAEEGGEWVPVPKGFRVVWKEFGRSGDAASVAQRMRRVTAPPRRRDPRNAPAPLPRDRRGTPLRGAASMIGALAHLGDLLRGEERVESEGIEPNGQYVICLPGAGGKSGAAG